MGGNARKEAGSRRYIHVSISPPRDVAAEDILESLAWCGALFHCTGLFLVTNPNSLSWFTRGCGGSGAGIGGCSCIGSSPAPISTRRALPLLSAFEFDAQTQMKSEVSIVLASFCYGALHVTPDLVRATPFPSTNLNLLRCCDDQCLYVNNQSERNLI
jgi:hypothetical protein